jgi:hypothetical protein
VGLDELVGGDGVTQDLGELRTASLLGLTTAVGQKDVGELDACFLRLARHFKSWFFL